MNFTCINKNCDYSDLKPYKLNLKPESILDENNLGAFFCPHCQQILEKVVPDTFSVPLRSVA